MCSKLFQITHDSLEQNQNEHSYYIIMQYNVV